MEYVDCCMGGVGEDGWIDSAGAFLGAFMGMID